MYSMYMRPEDEASAMPHGDRRKIARFRRTAHAKRARCLKLGRDNPDRGRGARPIPPFLTGIGSWGGGVRVWQITSWRRDQEGGRPLPEGAKVGCSLSPVNIPRTAELDSTAARRAQGRSELVRRIGLDHADRRIGACRFHKIRDARSDDSATDDCNLAP